MAETGIEDIIRGDDSSGDGGCGASVLLPIVIAIVIFICIGLLVAYCGGDPNANTNSNRVNSSNRRN
jgi:hypothetical protein